ncbi:MAG: hypothetical protein ABW078_09730 [Sedimenticola sp.]
MGISNSSNRRLHMGCGESLKVAVTGKGDKAGVLSGGRVKRVLTRPAKRSKQKGQKGQKG